MTREQLQMLCPLPCTIVPSSTCEQWNWTHWRSVGMHLCAPAVAEPSAGPSAHITVTNCGVATPFVTVENTLCAWPVPERCVRAGMSHPSTHLFAFLSKRCSLVLNCQQIWVGLCQEGLQVGSCPLDDIPQQDPPSF